jgi:hypothetical protein
MKRLSLEDRLARVDDALIGLWRFRERGRPARWCATYVKDGFYYDVSGKANPAQAVDAVLRGLRKKHHRGKSHKSTPRRTSPVVLNGCNEPAM